MLEMATFAEVVERGSFTAAAEALGVSKGFVSKQVAGLEARLGVSLMRRTTRRLHLTEEGERFYDYCRRLVQIAREGEAVMRSRSHSVSGRLRISAPISLGQVYLVELVEEFCAEFAGVEVDLVLDNRFVDLEDFDLAFRISENLPEHLSVTPLGMMEDVVCAAPSYLEGRSTPVVPSDLVEHRCLLYLNPGRGQRWTFRRQRRVEVVEVSGPSAYNYHTALLGPLLAGRGIAKQPGYFVAEYLRDGRLVRLLPSHQCDALPIYLVHRELSGQPPRVREFVSFVLNRWERVSVGLDKEVRHGTQKTGAKAAHKPESLKKT
ncbi:MAG: LysR family transcriptional regulator [Candidatus Eremiobacteraeota bacterium]|nr:LysR family transcriptional regulator [Candidatus Eremiobacteraeota bacterium]